MRILIWSWLFLVAYPSFALTSSKHSCRILLKIEKVTGEIKDVQFSSNMKTKEACQMLAQIHRKNFDPEIIKSKRVTYIWKKTTKTIPMLARGPIKKLKKSKRSRAKTL